MTPACKRHVVHIPASDLRAGKGNVLRVRLDHLRKDGDTLVCAEGEATTEFTLPSSTTDIWCVGNRVYAHRSSRNTLIMLSNNRIYLIGADLKRVVRAIDSIGDIHTIAICDGTLYYLSNVGVTVTKYTPSPTSTNICLHHERLFGADGLRIRYSKPLDFSSWESYGEQDAGWCDLFPSGGNVVDVVSMRDKVYFLRQSGISRFTGYADVYNFRLEEIEFELGEILSHAAVIGENAYFFTSCGLCRFDGTKPVRVESACDEDIDLAQPIRVDTAGGKMLAASVTLKDGSSVIYLYGPSIECGRFVRHSFEKFAAGDDMYLMREGELYQLTGQALPTGGECALTTQLCFASLGEGEKRLEAVMVAGQGTFTLEAVGEDGTKRTCSGKAGVWTDFAAGVRGERVTLRVICADAGVQIEELTLRVRREDRI